MNYNAVYISPHLTPHINLKKNFNKVLLSYLFVTKIYRCCYIIPVNGKMGGRKFKSATPFFEATSPKEGFKMDQKYIQTNNSSVVSGESFVIQQFSTKLPYSIHMSYKGNTVPFDFSHFWQNVLTSINRRYIHSVESPVRTSLITCKHILNQMFCQTKFFL